MRWALAFAVLAFAPLPASAEPAEQYIEIEEGQPFTLAADKAYFLLRLYRPKGAGKINPIFLRVPGETELKDYYAAREVAFREAEPDLRKEREKQLRKKAEAEAKGKIFKDEIPPEPTLDDFDFFWDEGSNVEHIEGNRALVKSGDDSVLLVEVPPGEYVLFGGTFGGILRPGLHVCFCLGTVGFEAKAGAITDLGYFLADAAKEKSEIPELAAESGFGPSTDVLLPLLTGTVRPVRSGDLVPSQLTGMPIMAADYHAIGRYFHPGALGVNRLIPVPGVLSYDRGKVIDVKSGKALPDRF